MGALSFRGESATANVVGPPAESVHDGLPHFGVPGGVSRREVHGKAQEVVPDLHLPVTSPAGADTDGGNGEPVRDLLGQLGGG